MVKKPDISDITKKLDIGGFVNSIKSMINPTGGTPTVDPSDALGVKIAQISMMLQKLIEVQNQQTKDLAQVNQLMNGLFRDLEALRHPQVKETHENFTSEGESHEKKDSSEEK